ncbi:MAG: protein tyrosine phosphatase family protein [Pseudohongiellaceae bacterium]|nr:protein tyrosine phosphatase family protein [Pseudohongiellaceae bacterium]
MKNRAIKIKGRGFIGTLGLLVLLASGATMAQSQASLDDIRNYREYSDTFASAGQPTQEQFELIQQSGFERIIYIAFNSGPTAVANEDEIVKGLGMDYLHIPVDFNAPTLRDFNAFADAMRRDPDQKTLLHCQVNARATAFSFLYRVIYEGVSVSDAKADMNTVWQPNEVWRDFIFNVLASYGKSVDECEECDWTPPSR